MDPRASIMDTCHIIHNQTPDKTPIANARFLHRVDRTVADVLVNAEEKINVFSLYPGKERTSAWLLQSSCARSKKVLDCRFIWRWCSVLWFNVAQNVLA